MTDDQTHAEPENVPSLRSRAVRGSGRAVGWTFRLCMKLVLILMFVTGGLFIGGFLQFTNKVAKSEQPADVNPAQAIVALTGGSARIATALKLLADKKGTRLLISGVNAETQRADIQEMNAGHAALFECCVDMERVAEDTIGNAVETANWMRKHGFNSLIVVTSAYHMPRSLVEYSQQMPDVQLTPYPVPLDAISKQGWWKNAGTLRFMLNEYVKFVGARLRPYLRPQMFDALRGSI